MRSSPGPGPRAAPRPASSPERGRPCCCWTVRAAGCQDLDLSPVVERTVRGARFSLRLGETFDRRYEEPLTYMTQRRRLDAFLVEAAVAAGATFQDGEPVRALEGSPNGGGGARGARRPR